jgi:hypothetical protein
MSSRSMRRWWGIGTLLLALLALLAAGRAALTLIYLGWAYADQINPITVPASYYVLVDGGRSLFTSAAVALAVGVLAVLFGMTRAGVRVTGRPTVLFTVWAGCLLLAAIFPIDASPYIESFAGWVHQFAGAGILALLSFAGLAAVPRLAENTAWRPVVAVVRVLSIGAALLAAAYVLSRLTQFVPALAVLTGGVDVGGMLQRAVFAFDIGVVTALAVHLVRVTWPALRDRTETLGAATLGADPAGPAAPLGP